MKRPSSGAQDATPSDGKPLVVFLPAGLLEALVLQADDEGLEANAVARRAIRLHLHDLATTTTGSER